MNTNEVATLLGYSREKVLTLVNQGLSLPTSKAIVKLACEKTGNDLHFTDEQLDEFLDKFETEQPGRYPPTSVRRALLVESSHKCSICNSDSPLEFHHMLEWSKIKHHDPEHMLAICGTCHSKCSNGQIDYKSQCLYKMKLATPKPRNASEDLQKEKDLETIKDMFSVFPRRLVDLVLEDAADSRIHYHHIDCLVAAIDIFNSTLFHLYDQELEAMLTEFLCQWNLAWEAGRSIHHDHTNSGIATLNLTDFDSAERWGLHKTYLEHVMQARVAMKNLTKYLADKFPEFDAKKSDQESAAKYWKMVKEVEDRFRQHDADNKGS